MTLLQLLTDSRNILRDKGIESARLDAELLLGHCLCLDRVSLYLEHDRPLLEHEVRACRELVSRRACREPVAYITGRRDFWTLTLQIERGVLIPRPETEVLVERALAFLSALAVERPRVLDIGTGSGAIALALAAGMPGADIVALDASGKAAACARANAKRLGFCTRVRVVQARFPELCAQYAGPYHLIVSNPPYIASGDIKGLAPDIRDHEPLSALDGGADGLDVYQRWIPRCAPLLVSGGALMLEIGHDQGPAVTGLLVQTGDFTGIEVARDYSRRDRVVICCRV